MNSDKNTCCGYPVHEAAALFPLMSEPELKELAEDIKTNGLIYPVIMCDNKVLDGRNRLLACEIAGVCVYFRDFKAYRSEHSPTSWVLATNLKRRQLTATQRTTVAVEAEPLLAKEAAEEKARRVAESNRNPMAAKLPPSEKPEREARAKAAKIVGVSPRYVTDGKKIKEKSLEVFKQMANGEKTISAAKKELGLERPSPKPDYPAINRASWLKCTKQQQEKLRVWHAKHSK